MARDFGFISLDYDEEQPDTSDITVVGRYKGKKQSLFTGDVIADFRSVIHWLYKVGAPEVVYSSTIDNLWSDSNIYYRTNTGLIGKKKVKDGNKETGMVSSQGTES